MAERILLSTYVIKILDNKNNLQVLSRFNGTDDFLDIANNFCTQIFQNIQKQTDASKRSTLFLTLDSPAVQDTAERHLYGFISSGVGGEKFYVRNIDTNKKEFESDVKKHASFKNVFFHFYIPRGRTQGFLVLQRKSKFGVKIVLKNTLIKYLKTQGYQDYTLMVNNVLHHSVYKQMMAHGKLKKLEFIKKRIPNTIEELYGNSERTIDTKGTLKTSLSASGSLSGYWKDFVNKLFQNGDRNTRIEIQGDEMDEVEFELELNGKKKTFYVKNTYRVQPDVDVTENITFENGDPTVESLVKEALDLIKDLDVFAANNDNVQ